MSDQHQQIEEELAADEDSRMDWALGAEHPATPQQE